MIGIGIGIVAVIVCFVGIYLVATAEPGMKGRF